MSGPVDGYAAEIVNLQRTSPTIVRDVRLVTSYEAPNLVDDVIAFRQERLGTDGLDPWDEFSAHYVFMSPDDKIQACLLFTRLGGNTLLMERDFDEPIPEKLRSRVGVIGHLISRGRLSNILNLIRMAWFSEFDRGARIGMTFVQDARVRQYQRYGYIKSTQTPIAHSRTGNPCFNMLSIAGLKPAKSPLFDPLSVWPEENEIIEHRGYLERLGVRTDGINSKEVDNAVQSQSVS